MLDMVLVPREAARDMLQAAHDAQIFINMTDAGWAQAYEAMIAAAPASGKVTGEQVEKMAEAMFESLEGDVHNTKWAFMKGPVNVDAETKERYRKMVRAALASIGLGVEE